jgi:hypothetical protein
MESKRLLGITPNYRSSQNFQNYQPLTPAENFSIASEDSLDRGTFLLAEFYEPKANGQTGTDLSAREPLASANTSAPLMEISSSATT